MRYAYDWVPKGDLAEGIFEFRFSRTPSISIFHYINGTRNKSIQIDMIFKYIFHPGLPGNCLYKSVKKSPNLGKAKVGSILGTFIKTFSRESRMENILKYHIYLEIFVTGVIYVKKYRI